MSPTLKVTLRHKKVKQMLCASKITTRSLQLMMSINLYNILGRIESDFISVGVGERKGMTSIKDTTLQRNSVTSKSTVICDCRTNAIPDFNNPLTKNYTAKTTKRPKASFRTLIFIRSRAV